MVTDKYRVKVDRVRLAKVFKITEVATGKWIESPQWILRSILATNELSGRFHHLTWIRVEDNISIYHTDEGETHIIRGTVEELDELIDK